MTFFSFKRALTILSFPEPDTPFEVELAFRLELLGATELEVFLLLERNL